MTNKQPSIWAWFHEKMLPPLFVLATASVFGAAYSINQSVAKLTFVVDLHSQQINDLKLEVSQLRASTIQRSELLEILKRVEQQLEIAMLKAGARTKVRVE